MNISGNSSFDYNMAMCGYIYMAWTLTYVLLLPVFLFVLGVGLQRCRNPRSRPSKTTHSDVFTFNMAAVEVIMVLGSCVFLTHFNTGSLHRSHVVKYLLSMAEFIQTLLHILVCLERYLAVVHAVTYLRLKKKGVAIRNASIAGVWLFSLCLVIANPKVLVYVLLFTGMASLVVITFFCASVLYILIRPGPGERGGDRKHVDQSKRRACHTVAAITVVLMLKFVPVFVANAVYWSDTLSESEECLMAMISQWFYIPTSLVLPLLFLYRRVKQRKRSTELK